MEQWLPSQGFVEPTPFTSVFVYTINEVADIQRMALIGEDGVISDFPDRACVASLR